MNYAQKYNIGNNQSTRKKATKTIVPTVERVRQLDAKTQRRKRNSERQTEISTNGNVANGFLKTSFLPKLKLSNAVKACRKIVNVERDFYNSLSKIADHYKIQKITTNQFEYPYNMALALWDVEEKLMQRVINWDGIRLVQDDKKTFIISEEIYNTRTTLYYIPIEPLYQMLHEPKRKRSAQLLLSVCSYLYHIADIPFFRQEDSYLYWMYEMHKDWVEQDDETEETERYKREFAKAEFIGDRIEQKLYNHINLNQFEQRLKTFICCDTIDQYCYQMSCNAFALYSEYPQASIFRNAPISKDTESEEEENEIIDMKKYISFISHTRGWLYENISESINNEFNEYGAIQEPTIRKNFDGSKITTTNLDFENRLFALLNDLCSLLHNYKMTR